MFSPFLRSVKATRSSSRRAHFQCELHTPWHEFWTPNSWQKEPQFTISCNKAFSGLGRGGEPKWNFYDCNHWENWPYPSILSAGENPEIALFQRNFPRKNLVLKVNTLYFKRSFLWNCQKSNNDKRKIWSQWDRGIEKSL